MMVKELVEDYEQFLGRMPTEAEVAVMLAELGFDPKTIQGVENGMEFEVL